MYEYLSNEAEPGPWPGPAPVRAVADTQAVEPTTAVAEVIMVTGDTRRLTHLSAGLLAAVVVGAATVTAALLIRDKPLALGVLGLLIPVFVSWLVAAGLVLHSEGPVTSAYAELRRATGAPVDPAAPWVPVGVRSLADSEVTPDYLVPLIAATRRQHEKARLALSAAVLTTAAFLLWTALSLAAAAFF